jgi:hypothetical protein
MLCQFSGVPGNAEGSKHLHIGIRVGLKRIEQRAIPIKQHCPKRFARQHEIIVADASPNGRVRQFVKQRAEVDAREAR